MKKLIIAATIAAASLGTNAEMIHVSNILATTQFEGAGRIGDKVHALVRLTDTSRLCGKGELEAIVTASTGRTGTGCWRVVGDAVYLTGINVLQDAMIPISQFEGSPLPVGKMAGK